MRTPCSSSPAPASTQHRGTRGWQPFLAVALALLTILSATLACAVGSGGSTGSATTTYGPDGPFLHEVLIPASSPARQHKKYAVLLCRAADVATKPLSVSSVKQMFLKDGQGTGNVYDYFVNISYGTFDLDGSVVYVGTGSSGLNDSGWYTMTSSKAQLDARNNGASVTRSQTDADCQAAAAKDGFHTSDYVGVVSIINIPTDSGQAGAGNDVVVGYPTDTGGTATYALTFVEHEMGHAVGLAHSMAMTMDTTAVHTWSPGGNTEYDDCWDIMSAWSCVYGYPEPRYSTSGPGLEAAYREQKGWMPSDRVYTYKGSGTETVVLAPVSAPRTPGKLIAKIPAGTDGYYTVEFRTPTDWDQGIPHATVLIHEMHPSGLPKEPEVRSFLVRRLITSDTSVSTNPTVNAAIGGSWLPGQVFQDTAHRVRISIGAFSGGTATVTISDTVSSVPGSDSGGVNNCDADSSCGSGPAVSVTAPLLTPSLPSPYTYVRLDGASITLEAAVSSAPGHDIPEDKVIWYDYAGSSWTMLGAGRTLSTPLPIGTHSIKVVAEDWLGRTAAQDFDVHVCDDTTCSPKVRISAPASGTHVTAGNFFTLVGVAFDLTGIDIPSDNYAWSANVLPLGPGSTLKTQISTPGTYTITLKVTNSMGYAGLASITLVVDPRPTIR